MSWEAIAIIFATLCGPILAVQAQKWIEWLLERRNIKKRIFHALMATRAAPVSVDHVQALNMIDLEFSGRGWMRQSQADKEVVKKWRVYSDHLHDRLRNENDQAEVDKWIERKNELFVDLLEVMAKATLYDFDRVLLKKGIYVPVAYEKAELKREALEEAVMGFLSGKNSLSMNITDFPVSDEMVALQKSLSEKQIASYHADGSLRTRSEN